MWSDRTSLGNSKQKDINVTAHINQTKKTKHLKVVLHGIILIQQ